MYPYLNQEIPLVFVCNTSETFFEYMSRAIVAADRARLIQEMQGLADRALLYPIASKLVFVSAPIPHAGRLAQQLGYQQTQYRVPQHPSPFLSLDILNDQTLLQQIVDYAGPKRTIQLVPHATTPQFLQLAEALTTCGLTVLLPESPSCLWLRDDIDTKSGFRNFISQWLADFNPFLPEGVICPTLDRAAAAAFEFTSHNRSCIVKADRGNDALGHTIFHPSDRLSLEQMKNRLQQNSFLLQDLILVEAFISSSRDWFPSVELFVPSPEVGEPQVTYVCNQCFHDSGTLAGVVVSRELEVETWYADLVEKGLRIAHQLQGMGYVGHFDLDAIINDTGQLFLVEINARRTGGTHVHEFASHLLGRNYLDTVTLLSHSSMQSDRITQLPALLGALEPWLYPMNGQQMGVFLTHTSALADRQRFGYILVAPSTQEALKLQRRVVQAIHDVPGDVPVAEVASAVGCGGY